MILPKIIIIFITLFSLPVFSQTGEDNFKLKQLNNNNILKLLEQCEKESDLSIKNNIRMDFHTMALCNAASAEVRERLFDNNWEKFLEWRKERYGKK